jgi:hypothetical protein
MRLLRTSRVQPAPTQMREGEVAWVASPRKLSSDELQRLGAMEMEAAEEEGVTAASDGRPKPRRAMEMEAA